MLAVLTILLALVTLFSTTVLADHHVCGWTGPGPGDPAKYGFKQYCIAARNRVEVYNRHRNANDLYIEYLCKDTGKRVADWNVLTDYTLELATPCNGGGYSKKHCLGDIWSMCLSNSSNSDFTVASCFYIVAHDDCEWPGEFSEASLPQLIGIFYQPR